MVKGMLSNGSNEKRSVSLQKNDVKETVVLKEGGHKSGSIEYTGDIWTGKRTEDGDCGDILVDNPAGAPRALDSPVGQRNLVDELISIIESIQNNHGAVFNFNIHQHVK